MSESVSVAATLYDGRGKAQQQPQQHRQHQPRQPPLQQQQQQSHHQPHFYRDRSAAGRADGDGENTAQQQQQQQRRSRRPRSIHITLRKTRAGSRPVNIQRNQHPYAVSSSDRVGSPTADAARPRELQPGSSSNAADIASYQLVSDTTPPRAGLSATVQRDPASATSRYSPGSLGGERRGEPTLHSPRVVLDAPVVQSRGSRAGSASDLASGQHARVPSSSGGSNTINHNNANGGGGGGSSSSSLNGLGSGGGGSNGSVGPSSVSGCGPTQQIVPQLNTFMKAPHATLQQLLPPGMKDRSGAGNSGVHPHPHRGYGASGGDARGGGEDAFVPVQLLQQQGSAYGPGGGRLRSRSQVYISSSNLNLATEPPSGFGGHRLRSNSSAAPHDNLGGSYSGVLGDFVFPYPDRNATQAPPALRTPPAATATIAANAPTLNFESRSPRLSPPVLLAGHTDPLSTPESHQHTRARSYTAGGSYGTHHTHHHVPNPFHHHRSSNTPVITASMAGVGGAALFTAHGQTASMGHGGGGGENSTSRNLDQSLSMSSNPAGLAGTLAVSASASIMIHNNVNTSRSSLRSGTTRETTPVRTTLAGTSTTPTAPQQQQLPSHPQRPTLTPSATGTPVPLGCSTRKSDSFAPGRSASLDVVNGLDDSVDSVLCGSSPRRRLSGHAAGPHRYLNDSVASDSGGQQYQQRGGTGANTPPPALAPTAAGETRRPRRYSTTLTDDDDNGNSGSGSGAPALSTLERLRSRRDTNISVASGGSHHNPSSTRANAAEPKTAIERWRAQEGERRRRAEAAVTVAATTTPVPSPAALSATRSSRHRLSARQWRDAFRRLEENRLQWTLRSFIGAGTSGKVYEGVLDNDARTPVAVKVLDVGVPMPVGASSAGDSEEPNMSPAQQEALLVLLREVEMMERLHQENIVTCLRCQVTPVHDRFMELHHHQQQQQQQQRRQQQQHQQQQRLSDFGGVSGAPSGGVSPYRVIPNAAAPGAAVAATRVPVQVEIIMELCKRGTLASVVRRSPGGQLPVVAARRYLRDVLKGLAYLHRNNFIHRDVKGENVLISADDVAKLADFGCSRRIVMTNSNFGGGGDGLDGAMSSLTTTHATDSRYTTVAADYQWCEATGVAQTMVGTPMFMAPEIIQSSGAPPTSPSSMDSAERHGAEGGGGGAGEENGGEGNTRSGGFGGGGNGGSAATAGYTASADIWSFGCLVLEVFGRTPWPAAGNNVYRLMKQIEQSVDALPPGVPPDTPAELLSVLRCCFYRDPHRRSTARMLLRSPWMTCKDEELQEMPPRRRR